ncbi:class II glutamine amidotransferase [Aliiroseovarius crassostreae]|uniref:class II glutamine amidotransferase n=1 Tax=Aliiroseovarius crassostreae TaxID=154981 RepID=UPI0021FD6BBB|nr:class II glutamine amidotransferase [Aliiroseovarius crassostreae]UWP90405.1 class II glutamine amidotransferase [Aliiroseovarius crassostreae]UWP93550.1 class II glutamine amidotransferase [Aliiroseovarius crassostreae]UWP99854.1 class II glutamine amidotransferase [Aliiroseovarius crassostreae]
MCRWAAYLGMPIFLEDVVTRPGHSLIAQSQDATECKTATNGDGFGLAWYDARPEPGLYRDIYPAWSDPNLRAVCRQVQSGLFLAHVRASTGSAISRNNCHPFVHENWSFMHNGQFGGFEHFRKQADMAVPDALYPSRKGATDSEVLFLLALAEGLDRDPAKALARAAGTLSALSQEKGATPHMRLSAAFSDGEKLWAARASSDHIAPSVYYRWSPTRQGWAVVSEPLEKGELDWIELPPGHIAQFDGDRVNLTPLPLFSC